MTVVITTINSGDQITNSRIDLNNNFDALNTGKLDSSMLSTDDTFTSASNSKIPSQLAVRSYVDSGGNQNASETTRGIVQEATDAQVTAGTATGSTGAKLFVTPAKLATRTTAVLSGYQTTLVYKNGIDSYNVATASGTQNIAHGLGVVPKKVRIDARLTKTSTTTYISNAITIYSGGTQSSQYTWYQSSSSAASGTDFSILTSSGDYATGVITVDATNIKIAWTKTSSPTGVANLTWEAEG